MIDPVHDLQQLLAGNPSTADLSSVNAALDRGRRVKGAIDAVEALYAQRLSELHSQGKSLPASDVLVQNGHMSAAEARRRERRAKALAVAAKFAEALERGDVNAEHADVLANVTLKLDEQTKAEFLAGEHGLVNAAAGLSPEKFNRHCRNRIDQIERDRGLERAEQQRRETRVIRKILPDGMHVLNGVFHPELGTRIFEALDAELGKLVAASGDRDADRTQLAAVALGNLVTGGHQAARGVEADVTVIVDLATLLDDVHDHSVCETGDGVVLLPETIRRLACNGRLNPVILGTDGVPISVGREHRLANRAQRRALRAMYRTCAFPGCDVHYSRCEIHHLHEWELGGPTDLANLLPLCSRHHHLVHELKWRLELDPERTLTVTRPDGTIHSREPIQIDPGRGICQHHRQRRTNSDDEAGLTS
jgi:hypothetical protein